MESARLQDYTVYYENREEYHRVKREVWGKNMYYVEIEREKPVIIDAGAHIGLTTLYYKRLFPQAIVVAIEPLLQNARLLRKNVEENLLAGVEVEEVALSESEGEAELYYDGGKERWYSTAGFTRGAWNGEQESAAMKVRTRRLGEYLVKYAPDLVKLDIEGAEEKVLKSAREEIGRCPHYLIEWHPVPGNELSELVKLFEERGYRVGVSQGGKETAWQKARGMAMVEAVKK